MTVNNVFGAASAGTTRTTTGRDFTSLGQGDFLRLLTVQMQQQDPFDPVDNKEMLAQMAQFSSLAGMSEMNDTLKAISTKLDVVLAGQTAAQAQTPAPSTDIPQE